MPDIKFRYFYLSDLGMEARKDLNTVIYTDPYISGYQN